MTKDTLIFIKFDHKENNYVTYGENTRGKILEGAVGNPSITTIESVLLVKGLKHNLLSVSKSWDKGYFIVFDTLNCLIEYKESKSLVLKGSRIDNICLLDLDDVSMYGTKYLVTKNEYYWLLHRRL